MPRPNGIRCFQNTHRLFVVVVVVVARVTVHLYNVTDLPAKGQREGVDAVVHGCLLPDEKFNLKSKIIKDTLNPIFDDTMEFPVDVSKDFSQQALRLSVFDSDNCSKLCAIAHTIIPLTDCDMDGKQKEMKKKLQKKAEVRLPFIDR